MNRRRLIVQGIADVGEAQLTADIIAETKLPADQAVALAGVVMSPPPRYIECASDSDFPAEQVAKVLNKHGFDVIFAD